MSQKPATVAIIPSRFGSTRLPAKPLVDLLGKPMVQRVYERARMAKCIDRVIVATDHERIADAVRKFGGEVMMTPESLRSGTDRVAWAANRLPDAGIIVNIQGDEPLIVPAMIDEAVEPLLNDLNRELATLAKVIDRAEDLINPAVVKVVLDRNNDALYFSRSPIPYCRDTAAMVEWPGKHRFYKHIGLYVYRRTVLMEAAGWEQTPLERAEQLEQLRMLEHGRSIHVRITEHDTVSVDTPDDVHRVIELLQSTEGRTS